MAILEKCFGFQFFVRWDQVLYGHALFILISSRSIDVAFQVYDIELLVEHLLHEQNVAIDDGRIAGSADFFHADIENDFSPMAFNPVEA